MKFVVILLLIFAFMVYVVARIVNGSYDAAKDATARWEVQIQEHRDWCGANGGYLHPIDGGYYDCDLPCEAAK